ncbi:MAG: LamG domain-containing protein [Treponema sp.]
MKKITSCILATALAIALTGCVSGGTAAKSNLATKSIDPAADPGVVGYYTFDEEVTDNEVVDHSSSALDIFSGAMDGSVTVEGVKGKALQFNGNDEYLTLDQSALEGDGFTFAAWIKADMWTTWARFFDIGDTKKDVFMGVDGRQAGTIGLREESSQAQVNAPLPEMGVWTHVAGSFGDGKLKLYVDGAKVQEIICNVTPAKVAATAQGLYVGRSNWADPFFKGLMDEIVIAKRVLAPEEIAYLAQQNAPAKAEKVDLTLSANPFTITEDSGVVGYYTFDEDVKDNEVVDHSGYGLNVYTGALEASQVVDGKNGKALNFNGEDEYLTLESDAMGGDGLTISMWIKPNVWNAWARIFDLGDTKEDLWLGTDGGVLRCDCIGTSGNVTLATSLPKIGEWTHVALTLGNGEICLYVNGNLKQKNATGATPSSIGANATGLYVGRSNWADPLYNGLMDDVFVASRAFSAEEIASVYKGIK